MQKQFVINKTLSTLLFKNGYITIPRGQYAPVSVEDLALPEFSTARTREWIDISENEPVTIDVPAVQTVVIENHNKGMSADELKAELATSTSEKEATVEAIGQGPVGVESEGEAKAEAIGQDTTVEVDPTAEAETTKPVRTRKAK